MDKDIYHGRLKLHGEEDEKTLTAANNYAASLCDLRRFKEAKSLLHTAVPMARRILGDSHDHTLSMRSIYATALYCDTCATLDDVREAVTTLEETERVARRVLGGAHPTTTNIERDLQFAREMLAAHETQSPGHS